MDKEKVLEFIIGLQKELKEQDKDCQAAPRFWTVGDYEMKACPEGEQDEYMVIAPNNDYSGNINDLLENLKRDEYENYSDYVKGKFNEIEFNEIDFDYESAIDWIKEYYDVDAYLVPVREEHIIRKNTMFITKQEAKAHIKANKHHYSDRAHTYAMTAWRAPQVEKILEILEEFDWQQLS